MYRVKPKKALGQHFLKDLNIASNIADTIDGYPSLPILEIGPGMGVLTKFLLKKNRPLKVIEIDKESIEYLKISLPDIKENIIEGDFLKTDITGIYKVPFCVIGNYPYNISSQIFFKVLEHKDRIPCCSGMIQKEVAERIASKPGKKAYGILSVLLQAYYDIEYLFTVDEYVFDPPPSIKSAVIRLKRNRVEKLNCDEKLFKSIIKISFNQRRKTLRNSLKNFFEKNCPIKTDPIFDKRPEQLSVDQFVKLTNMIDGVIKRE